MRWAFLGGLAFSGMVLLFMLIRHGRLRPRDYVPVTTGLALLLAFVIIRASPIAHINTILGVDVSSIPGKRHILELGGILWVAVGVIGASRR